MVLYLRSLLTTNFKYTKTLLSKDNKVFLASQERFELRSAHFRTILYILIAVLIYLLLRECLPIPSSHFYDSPIRVSFITDVLYCKIAITIFSVLSANFSVKSLSFDLAIFAPSPFLYDLLKPSNQSQVQSIGDSHFPLLLIVTHCRG